MTITPAETHHDEVGRYFIGDPPRLYYARILRSKTVMLRVGGEWEAGPDTRMTTDTAFYDLQEDGRS